jgi:glyoxylase-like metal-dependent hydrolase (beta-lactamase superfamily II)
MGIYLKKLLAGRDFGIHNEFARQMANFVYLVGDDEKRECLVVDPAWDIRGIIDYIEREEMKLVGALVTHYHPDHIGGNIFGHDIEGLAELMQNLPMPIPIYVNKKEREGVLKMASLDRSDIRSVNGGDEVMVGSTPIKLLHTPGHTPGSQCFLIGSTLVSGDTLFIGGCGRVDLPGGDAEQMYYSLTHILAKLPDDTFLYPGHNYSTNSVSTIGDEKLTNYYLRINSLETWKKLMS